MKGCADLLSYALMAFTEAVLSKIASPHFEQTTEPRRSDPPYTFHVSGDSSVTIHNHAKESFEFVEMIFKGELIKVPTFNGCLLTTEKQNPKQDSIIRYLGNDLLITYIDDGKPLVLISGDVKYYIDLKNVIEFEGISYLYATTSKSEIVTEVLSKIPLEHSGRRA